MIEKEILEKTLKYNYSTELDKLRQHIVDLRIVSTSFESHLQEKDKEIERLNNIIDELEKDINLELMKLGEPSEYNKGLHRAFLYIDNELAELKGSDKE